MKIRFLLILLIIPAFCFGQNSVPMDPDSLFILKELNPEQEIPLFTIPDSLAMQRYDYKNHDMTGQYNMPIIKVIPNELMPSAEIVKQGVQYYMLNSMRSDHYIKPTYPDLDSLKIKPLKRK